MTVLEVTFVKVTVLEMTFLKVTVQEAGSDLPGGVRVLTPLITLPKKLDPPLVVEKKEVGGSGFWDPRLDIGEMDDVSACACVKVKKE